jgi:hypothetical protein
MKIRALRRKEFGRVTIDQRKSVTASQVVSRRNSIKMAQRLLISREGFASVAGEDSQEQRGGSASL